jgi:heterodisulfide reductase subunit C/quinone-modifying oxidoreductase subunit QmoC
MSAATIRLKKVGGGLAREVKTRSGASPMSCFQCAKCSSGCPVASRADVKPHELVRLVQMNQRRAVLGSRSIWECTSCQTCVTRCPQKVDIAAMNDALRAMSLAAGMAAPGTAVPVFNQVFLKAVRERGRVHEMGLMVEYKLRTLSAISWNPSLASARQRTTATWRGRALRLFADAGKVPVMIAKGKLSSFGQPVRRMVAFKLRTLFADADKAPMMIAKGKLSLFGPRVRGKAQRKAMFRRAAGGNP